MNERIQELHEEAMKSCDEHRSDILNYHRIYREKFARLIVNECIDIAYREGDNVAYLALHFGVEE